MVDTDFAPPSGASSKDREKCFGLRDARPTWTGTEGHVGDGVLERAEDFLLANVRVAHQQELQQVVVRLGRRRQRR